jgi:hypothetical protein
MSAGHYREESERCRKLAAAAKDAVTAERWRQLAREYDKLAEIMQARSSPPSPVHAGVHQQAAQQQHAKTTEPKAEG